MINTTNCLWTAFLAWTIASPILAQETAATTDRQDPSRPLIGEIHTGDPSLQPDPQRISDYVRRMFQDKNGDFWFGTNGDGVCRFDGKTIRYYGPPDGFGGFAVRGIVQDKQGALWFATDGGLTKFDGDKFTNWTQDDGIPHQDIWSICLDSQGVLWLGTMQGVCRFQNDRFESFELPEAKPDPLQGVTSSRMVRCIMEDSRGRMWFATNAGAFCYDGKTLENLSVVDGLSDNNVNCILEARDGAIWFATHYNGVCRYDGKAFNRFGEKQGIVGVEAWDLFQDRDGNIWFPIEQSGVYRFDGKTFKNFGRQQGLTSGAVQCMFQDRSGRIWFGGVFGLFRFDKDAIISVKKQGPW